MIPRKHNAVVMLWAALLALFALPSFADEVFLKDGRIIPLVKPHVTGNSLMTEVKIGAQVGEVGYGIDSITKIQIPKPEQLDTAAHLLALGKADEAIALLDPIINFYGPLKDVPGNWWVPAALLKTSALGDLRREAEAEPLLNDLSRLATDPESALLAKVRLAAIAAHRGQDKMALQVYDSTLDKSEDSSTLAETWVDKADSLLAAKDYEPALLAYLRVPVFYPDRKLLMPRALLGIAHAYKGMEDFKKATESLEQLTTDFAGSSESAVAATELKEIEALEKKNAPSP